MAAVAPLMISNLRAEVDEKVYATDASGSKGAIVSASLGEDTLKALWLAGDKKGGYSRLDNPFKAVLKCIEEFSDDEEIQGREAGCSPGRPPAFVFDFVEVCGGVGAVSRAMNEKGYVVAPPLDLSYSKAYNLEDLQLLSWIFHMLKEGRFRSVLCQPPCTTFSAAAHPACRSVLAPSESFELAAPAFPEPPCISALTVLPRLACESFDFIPLPDQLHFVVKLGLAITIIPAALLISSWVLLSIPPEKLARRMQPLGPLKLVVLFACFAMAGAPIAPENREELDRAEKRSMIKLQADRVVLTQTRDNRKRLLLAFQTWLHDEHDVCWDDLIFSSPPDPEAVCHWLVAYGRELHAAGKSYNKYVETINGIATARPLLRRQMAQAWDLAFAWLQDEPHQHHPALPQSILLSMLSTALLWGWPVVAAILSMTWAGVMRIGEVVYATRRDLVLPTDSAPDIDYILVRIKEPKSRGRAARHQSARIDPSDIVSLITKVFKGFAPSDRLWPSSAGTLRRRFNSLLTAVGLPTTRGPWGRPYDLGSLRPGGASWLLMKTENTGLIRRRGRWQSMRTLEIYLQDIQVATALHKLDEPVRRKIAHLAAGLSSILEKTLVNLDCNIPCSAWYFLFAQAT